MQTTQRVQMKFNPINLSISLFDSSGKQITIHKYQIPYLLTLLGKLKEKGFDVPKLEHG